tara:strand:- start:332 stop:1210 length:879 start_codon:yes stop_codon:yes gene_type:complete
MAFKMKGWSAGQGTGSHSALLKKQEAAMKLQKQAAMKRMDSAMDKPLVGNQKNLPKHLQEKIEAAPTKMVKDKSSMKRMSPGDGSARTKDKSTMKRMKDSSMKRMKNSPMHKDPDPFFEALKKDPNLRKLVEERNKHKKGTDEYAAAQNRINKAYENTKRHNVKTETTSKTNPVTGRTKDTTVETTPGIGTETTITKRKKDGTITKQKVDTVPSDYYEDEDATRSKQKQGKDKEFGTEDDKKKKKKKFKDTRVGQFLGVGQGDKRKKRREENRKNKDNKGKGGPFARMKNNR